MHSKNRKLDKEEQKHFGRKARLIAVLELAVLGILWYAGQIPYAYAVYTGICITALFMIVGKAQLWIQSHTEMDSPFRTNGRDFFLETGGMTIQDGNLLQVP